MAFTLNLSLQEIMLGIIIYASKFCGGGKFDVFSIHFYKLLLLPPSHNPRNTNRVFKGFSHLLKFSFRDVNKRNPTLMLYSTKLRWHILGVFWQFWSILPSPSSLLLMRMEFFFITNTWQSIDSINIVSVANASSDLLSQEPLIRVATHSIILRNCHFLLHRWWRWCWWESDPISQVISTITNWADTHSGGSAQPPYQGYNSGDEISPQECDRVVLGVPDNVSRRKWGDLASLLHKSLQIFICWYLKISFYLEFQLLFYESTVS